ncbi:hypothetical protein G6F57_022965 [Rhizopus arrhizus]|nr:hypothetical protein G6F29_014344 [Rhizopus arrhizus]KAG0988559.1 hypothetical protein G6F27_014288 [Rhizopus arrhizus]KAG1001681.1 hypothetical protein G6F26_014257 [Rhizopus arrhizus]KAG1078526.1 hypothetical protein G6F39_014359 [Rhizopus arrhizus]KAG1242573.1 hypothetical protein G6F65_022951 [Rhizopus arrhizus]
MSSINCRCLLLLLVLRSGLLSAQSCGISTGCAILMVITPLIPRQVKSGLTSLSLPREQRPDSPSGFFLPLPNHLSARCGGDQGADGIAY